MSDLPDLNNDHVRREIERQVARKVHEHNQEIEKLQSVIRGCKNSLVQQNAIITNLTTSPLVFGTLVKINGIIDPNAFKLDDEVIVCDKKSVHFNKGGRVMMYDQNNVLDSQGRCWVKLIDGTEDLFYAGTDDNHPAQIRLTIKDDGTSAVINLDGKPWEVRNVPDLDLRIGDQVKINPETKAIVGGSYPMSFGPICSVVGLIDDCVEIVHKGEQQLVYNPKNIELKEGDRVACDVGMFSVIKKLPEETSNRYNVDYDLNISWDDVGGLEGPKQELKDALELPYQHPDLFKHYKVEPTRGVLLYGPPGNGKTLLARICAWSTARIHNASPASSAFLYVKAPEILDKWYGNTEKEIRKVFDMCRRHFWEHGYKAVLVFDEADAVMSQRGSRAGSSIPDTVVPMFLGEMDGLNERQTEANPIVFLLTNRSDTLDPAITRPGRITRHIKIGRPDSNTSIDILKIHTKGIPFEDEEKKNSILAIASAELFSKSKLLYRVNGEYNFTLGDCASGAMLANIAEIAKMNALHRDIDRGTKTGVTADDFRKAVKKVYSQQGGINHNYDLQDFSEKHGIHSKDMNIERCFGDS